MSEQQDMQGRVVRDGGFAVIRIPLDQVHALRVALRCPCGATKSTRTEALRRSLDRALARVQPGGVA